MQAFRICYGKTLSDGLLLKQTEINEYCHKKKYNSKEHKKGLHI